ncbi:MAG: lysophospholipid acyltransferase family protein [Caldiserica bacterium]|nr:lysophospholipid acyltransferase family protein [Caldisericota bacterium]
MLYELVVPMGRLWFRTFFKFHVVGLENVPRHGPGLICGNHCSYLDPMLAAFAVPRKTYIVSRKEMYEQPLLGPFIRRLGGVRIDRESLADKGALQKVLAIMDHGDLCMIYPEGTRSPDGRLQIPHNGAAFLAVKSGAPVVPMAIIGSYECWPRQKRIPRVGRITVRIGQPITYHLPPERESRKEDLTAISMDIMGRIRTLQEEGHA